MGKDIKMCSLPKKQCELCQKYFSKSNMSRHTRSCEKKSEETRKRGIGRSITEEERKMQVVSCKKCDLPVTNPNRHERNCKGPKIYEKCPKFCGKEILNVNVKKHLISCKNSSMSLCILCNAVFMEQSKYADHIKIAHPEIYRKENEPKEDKNEKITKENVLSKRNLENTVSSEIRNIFQTIHLSQVYHNTIIKGDNYNGVEMKDFVKLKETVGEIKENVGFLNKECKLEKCANCPKIIKKNETEHICVPDIDGPQHN